MRSCVGQIVARWIAVAVLAGCAQAPRVPDLNAIYTSAAKGGTHRPLIAVPGTLGSRLVDGASGAVVWGTGSSRGLSADPDDPSEYRLIALPVPFADEPLIEVRDQVKPDGILDRTEANVLGIPIGIEIYGGIGRTLQAGGFRVARLMRPGGRDRDSGPPHARARAIAEPEINDQTVFRFDYDWRRDIIETAHRFGHYIEARRDAVAASRNVAPETVRFDLLAHSMGGLVARYFLMHGFADPGPDGALPPVTWEGAQYFERTVFVATPNAGSIIALDNLVNGKDFGPFQPAYPAALLGTHPSVYQLMPRARHKRVQRGGAPEEAIYDPALWQALGWGLADPEAAEQLAMLMPEEPDAERRRDRALAYQARLLRRAERFHQMMDRWAPAPEHLDLFLVVGGGYETSATGRIDPASGAFEIDAVEEGDGVVLRASVLLDERQGAEPRAGLVSPLRWSSTLFLPDEHVELTKNPVFGDNLLFWLLEAPRRTADLRRPTGGTLYNTPKPQGHAPARQPEPGGNR